MASVKEFLSAAGLKCGLDHILANVDYTYESKSNGSKSTIDHICLNDDIFPSLLEYSTIQSVDNMSDHNALYCLLEIDVKHLKEHDDTFTRKAAWYKANNHAVCAYKETLDAHLTNLTISNDVLTCKDPFCTAHSNDISTFMLELVKACLQAEDRHIPKTCPPVKRRMPGWNDTVALKRQEALHWHAEWKRHGRPPDGAIAEQMRQTRHQYHYAIRQCKKNKNKIRSHKMAEALLQNKNRDLWSEIRQLNQCSRISPKMVDGYTDSENITKTFSDKFKSVYTSVPYSESDMNNLNDRINLQVEQDFQEFLENIDSTMDVSNIINKLKAGKSDGYLGLSSDCILNGPPRLFRMLSILFRIMIIHGYAPEKLLIGTMSPIPKGANVNSSEKYRAITLISSILKLLDYLILRNQKNILETDYLQFGFKNKNSTTLCSAFFMEITNHFLSQNTDVHTVLLDATKAFDRVEYTLLFNLLLDKGLNSLYVRCLLYMYKNQKIRVKWNNIYSEEFTITNGVKQGGVLSPMLFGIYIDHLIQKLRESGFGCTIGPYFVGCIVYADDIVLLSPTKTGLEQMIHVCQDYSQQFHVKFNALKSQYVIFNSPGRTTLKNEHIMIDENYIKCQTSAKHLGHTIYANLTISDIDGVISSFYRQFNSLIRRFSGIPSIVKAKLFNMYCTSFYGALLIPLNKLSKLQAVYRKSIRQVYGLPYRTHCSLLASLPYCECSEHLFSQRFVKFASSALQHASPMVRYVFEQACQNSNSTFGKNVKHCAQLTSTDISSFTRRPWWESKTCLRQICSVKCRESVNASMASVIVEMCNVRDELYFCNLNFTEINTIIYQSCVL